MVLISKKGWSILKGCSYKESLILKISMQYLKSPSLHFSLEKAWCSCQCSLIKKNGHFELTNEELLMIIKYMELSNQTVLWQTILVACIHVLNFVFLSLIFVFFLSYQFIPVTTILAPVFYLSLGYYDLALYSHHLDSYYIRGCLNKKLGIKFASHFLFPTSNTKVLSISNNQRKHNLLYLLIPKFSLQICTKYRFVLILLCLW